jgi:hypothetical protein
LNAAEIATFALGALSWNDDLYVPRDLIVLIRERLGGSNPEYKQIARTEQLRQNAIFIGAQFVARGESPSFRKIGSLLGVAPSTVKRWFPNGEFRSAVGQFVHMFDENGNVRKDAPLLPKKSDSDAKAAGKPGCC